MALDDQLAALAAGELDDDDARALRARVAADPALARRLARHERLQQLLAGWDAPAMPDEATQRLEARVEEALAELGDEPLADRTPRATPLAATPETEHDRSPQARGVVDLDRERQRRAATPGRSIAWPNWGAGAAVAAVLAAIVGTGIVLGGLSGEAGRDMLAGGDDSGREESAEVAEDSADSLTGDADDSSAAEAPTEAEVQEEAATGGGAAADQAAQLGPLRRDGVDVAEGDLLALIDLVASTTRESTDDEGTDADTAAAESAEQCVTEALQRDTSQADDRLVQLLADGTYAGRDAAFVVVRTPAAGEDRYEVLAYDPDNCSLIARDEASR